MPSNIQEFFRNNFHDHSWLFMEIPDHNTVRPADTLHEDKGLGNRSDGSLFRVDVPVPRDSERVGLQDKDRLLVV